jgi:uncharacterized damage-inducible protein DinB
MFGKLTARGYQRNQWIIERQADGLTHWDSLVQTPYNINCLNWVLGHIANSRDDLLELLGRERIMDADDAAQYKRESDPITEDAPSVLPLEELLSLLHNTNEELVDALERLTDEQLAEEHEWGGTTSTLAEWCQFFYFHDTYHTGQTDLLRQVAGADDKVI